MLFNLLQKEQERPVIQEATREYLCDVLNTLYPTKDDTDEFQVCILIALLGTYNYSSFLLLHKDVT